MNKQKNIFDSKSSITIKGKFTNFDEYLELIRRLEKEVAQVEKTIEQLQKFELDYEWETIS